MKLHITDEAVEWYKNELELNKGSHLRFFARYGGNSTIHRAFSLGIAIEKPFEPAVIVEKDGITFFIEEKDLWYFQDHNISVSYDKESDEVVFSHE